MEQLPVAWFAVDLAGGGFVQSPSFLQTVRGLNGLVALVIEHVPKYMHVSAAGQSGSARHGRALVVEHFPAAMNGLTLWKEKAGVDPEYRVSHGHWLVKVVEHVGSSVQSVSFAHAFRSPPHITLQTLGLLVAFTWHALATPPVGAGVGGAIGGGGVACVRSVPVSKRTA